jgi:hypothetical protein
MSESEFSECRNEQNSVNFKIQQILLQTRIAEAQRVANVMAENV